MALQLEDLDNVPPSYNNADPPGYAKPGNTGYGQPNQPGYGQPGQPEYGGYGHPGQPGYGGYSQPGYAPYPPNHPMMYGPPQQQQQQQQVIVVGGGGPSMAPTIIHVRPPNYLALAIITTLCCNPLCGIIAIICSVMSSSAADDGETETARTRGKISCSFSVIGIIITVASVVALTVYFIVIVNAATTCYDGCY